MVPGEIGSIPEHREVTGTPREVYGPYWDLVEEREKKQRRERPPKVQYELGGGPGPYSFLFPPLSFSPRINKGKRGILLPVGVGLPWGAPCPHVLLIPRATLFPFPYPLPLFKYSRPFIPAASLFSFLPILLSLHHKRLPS